MPFVRGSLRFAVFKCESPDLTLHIALSDEIPAVRCTSKPSFSYSRFSQAPKHFSNLGNARYPTRIEECACHGLECNRKTK
jgi:hypothetical protein